MLHIHTYLHFGEGVTKLFHITFDQFNSHNFWAEYLNIIFRLRFWCCKWRNHVAQIQKTLQN